MPDMHGMPWSPRDDRQLAELWSAGRDSETIGARLGRSAAAVRVRAAKVGLPAHVDGPIPLVPREPYERGPLQPFTDAEGIEAVREMVETLEAAVHRDIAAAKRGRVA